ncbi:MAG: hypothetical protein Ct9H90mP7_2650 [Candidatus Neomarinimicrobiota bacterium]|nr:MAG: hypothetical protein Ct9H90mP7_2650 [Candidatus Neomarinimicrobiota bacterium]
MTYIIAFAFLISFLVFVHELGHYLAARSIGVKVELFLSRLSASPWYFYFNTRRLENQHIFLQKKC